MTTSLPKRPAAEAGHSLPMYVALVPWLLFTVIAEQYAREMVPRELRSSPKFKAIKRVEAITGKDNNNAVVEEKLA